MERAVNFAERPTPMDWGKKKHVPLNIVEINEIDENGEPKKAYRADIVPKVEQPLNVENIVKAAINSEYGENAAQKMTMALALNKSDEETEKFKKFVSEITEAAQAEGYK